MVLKWNKLNVRQVLAATDSMSQLFLFHLKPGMGRGLLLVPLKGNPIYHILEHK